MGVAVISEPLAMKNGEKKEAVLLFEGSALFIVTVSGCRRGLSRGLGSFTPPCLFTKRGGVRRGVKLHAWVGCGYRPAVRSGLAANKNKPFLQSETRYFLNYWYIVFYSGLWQYFMAK
jgi:hypothetical protein